MIPFLDYDEKSSISETQDTKIFYKSLPASPPWCSNYSKDKNLKFPLNPTMKSYFRVMQSAHRQPKENILSQQDSANGQIFSPVSSSRNVYYGSITGTQ